MRSTLSLTLVAVLSTVTFTLAAQNASGRSGSKGHSVGNRSSFSSRGPAKSFSRTPVTRPSINRSTSRVNLGPMKTAPSIVGNRGIGSQLSANPRQVSQPLIGKLSTNGHIANKPLPIITDKFTPKAPGWTPKAPGLTPVPGLTPKVPGLRPVPGLTPKVPDLTSKVLLPHPFPNPVPHPLPHPVPYPVPKPPKCPPGKPWCGWKPNHCWWWFNYCRPLQGCHFNDYRYYDGYYVRSNYYTAGQPVVADARWYLGVKGMILPGKGLGIEQVDANSPAAVAGLAPGMVITKCNGVVMSDEQAIGRAIGASSNGLVQMEVMTGEGGEPVPVDVQMVRLASVSY